MIDGQWGQWLDDRPAGHRMPRLGSSQHIMGPPMQVPKIGLHLEGACSLGQISFKTWKNTENVILEVVLIFIKDLQEEVYF